MILNNTEIAIIKSFGVLPEYLKYARSALIGKSLLKRLKNDGGQNPILAAQMGVKFTMAHMYLILKKYINFFWMKI